MKVCFEKQENKIILKVTLKFKGKKGFSKIFTNSDAVSWIRQNHPDTKLGNIISCPKKHLHNLNRLHGEWIFESCEDNSIDNLNNNVKIEKINIEANSSKEDIKKASLPNGLKNVAKTKRKKATKKKIKEE